MRSRHQWVGVKYLYLVDSRDSLLPFTGPRNRAPLGLKTTNAKTKAFLIPPPPSAEDAPDKSKQKSASASAREGRPRVSHAEMTKLDIHGDLDKLKEMDIEYMPPPAKSKRPMSELSLSLLTAFRSS